ncbi:MAG: membrane protein insertion efficiency factor YidD [Alphaproteobacteria bacterium]|jgi:hypothetical protein
MSFASRISIFLIKGYKYLISPYIGKSCRFEPSCSTYALEAFRSYGFFRGFKLSLFRIIRCNPWGGHGYDPVPSKEDNNI